MRKIPILGLMAALFLFSCGRGEKESSVRTERIDGIQHVFNTAEPRQGKIPLEVSEILRINPADIDPENPPLFETAVKDDLGNLYLADSRNVRVYTFDSRGKSVARFLGKGQGPGEFPMLGDLQVTDNYIWVIGTWPLKIAKFTPDGEFVGEWMFRTFRNFYLRTKVIGEDRFLTVGYRYGPGGQERVRVSALMNSGEEFLAAYYEDEDAGIFRLRTGQPEGPAIASTNSLVASDIHHAYDRDSGTVYVGNNREYEVQAKNADGTTRMVIHNTHKKIALDDQAKEDLLQMIAPRIPPEARQPAKEQLPPLLNAIWGMAVLPNGHLEIKRITGLESVEIDIFDKEGRLLYTILPSAEIPDLKAVTFFKNTVGVILEGEEKNIYVEYRVNNLKGVFDGFPVDLTNPRKEQRR